MPVYSYYMADLTRDRTASHGIINYSLGLLSGLAGELESDERLVVLGTSAMKRELEDLLPTLSRIEWDQAQAPSSTVARLASDHLKSIRWAKQIGADLIHFPKGFIPVRPPRTIKIVATIHDDIPIRYAEGEFGADAATRRYRYFARQIKHSARRADAVLAVSHFTKSRIAAIKGARPESIVVTHEAALPSVTDRFHKGPREPRLLLLGSTHPHKDTSTTVEFVARYLVDRQADLEFLVLGNVADAVDRLIAETPQMSRVRGVLDSDELITMISRSSALLFGSAYEGFGLPPLEAALLGTPVVYLRIPAVEEVMTGTHFPFESSYASFAAALDQALAASRTQISEYAASLNRRFAWPDVARKTLNAYREVL